MFSARIEGVDVLRRRLDAYSREVNKTAEEVIKDMASLGGRNLANKTFPAGTNNKVKDTLHKSIFKDINKAYGTEPMIYAAIAKKNQTLARRYGALVEQGRHEQAAQVAKQAVEGFQGYASSDSGSHLESLRNQKGRVDTRQQLTVSQGDYEQIKATKVLKAGLVKTAWLQAAESIGKPIRIPKWLKKSASLGTSQVEGESWGVSVTLINSVRYASSLITPNIIQKTIGQTYKGFMKFIERRLSAAARRV